MFTSKQRATLRSIAQTMEPVTQVGKQGINESLIDSLDKAIEKRELIKVTILENSGLIPKEAGIELASKLFGELVCVTGRKVVIYRRSLSDKCHHIEF